MIWQDKAFLSAYFLAMIIIQCFWQRALIKANKRISHFWHGVYYTLTALPIAYFFAPWWKVVVIAVAARLAFFDILLNAVRGLPLAYNGKGTTGSLIDKVENKLSSWAVRALKVIYLLIYVILVIFL